MASERRAGLEIERHDDGVTVVRLARPERRNAIDAETAVVLTGWLQDANTDRDVRAIVVTGVEGTFCTGADVVSDPAGAEAEARSTTATPPRTSAASPKRCGRSRSRWSAR